jgi:uncharacterized protein (TIGR00255 family)
LKSVNNRYLEVSCRLPSFISQCEQQIRDIIRNNIQRGKLYVTITIKGDTDGILGIRIDDKMVSTIRNLLNHLQESSGVCEELKLEHFLRFSEIFESYSEPEDTDVTWNHVKGALQKALNALKSMRQEEGKALVCDAVGRIQKIEAHIDKIERIAKGSVAETFDKLMERVKKLMRDHNLEQDRLYSEIALLADKMDITEECVRMRSHDQLFLQTLKKEESVGKKLNFLLQEMNREANTMSSKALSVEIGHLVVEMKEEIEKLREQVQNLE